MLKSFILVSIPQAVGTVATVKNFPFVLRGSFRGFNTASGRYCCNAARTSLVRLLIQKVSIPQAVGTVATNKRNGISSRYGISFNTASGRYCCNSGV